MTEKDRLIELIQNARNAYMDDAVVSEEEFITDFLTYCNDVVVLPCAIGDTVWALQSRNGRLYPKQGVVSSMFFNGDMVLVVVVKNISRGEFGKAVFLTKEEAEQAAKERSEQI